MTHPDRAALGAMLAATPTRVAAAAQAAQSRRLALGDPPMGWSERAIVAHLAAVEREVWQARLDQLGREDGPHWAWVEPGGHPGHATLAALCARFAARRAATLGRLARLDDAGWTRSGIHATFGRLDVVGLLRVALDHDADHLAELERRA